MSISLKVAWKSENNEMYLSQVKRLKEFKDKSRKLKQMHVDLAFENKILKVVIYSRSVLSLITFIQQVTLWKILIKCRLKLWK